MSTIRICCFLPLSRHGCHLLSERPAVLHAVCSRRGCEGSADIWVLDLQTKKARNLTHAPGSFRPCWSFDGKWIAFSSDRNTRVRRRDAERFAQVDAVRIYVMRADGTDMRRLTPAGKFAGSPKWSPDGKRVVFYEMEIQIRITPCDRDSGYQSIPFLSLQVCQLRLSHQFKW